MISILVVDEEQGYRERLAAEMSSVGYQVATAGDTILAKEFLQSRQPALVFLNPYMNEKEGFELLEQLRRGHSDASVVVMVPQHAPKDDWLSKAEGYFVKGPDLEGVKQVVAEIISGGRT